MAQNELSMSPIKVMLIGDLIDTYEQSSCDLFAYRSGSFESYEEAVKADAVYDFNVMEVSYSDLLNTYYGALSAQTALGMDKELTFIVRLQDESLIKVM